MQFLNGIWTSHKDTEPLKDLFASLDPIEAKSEGQVANASVPMCRTHFYCQSSNKSLKEVELDLFNNHQNLISVLDFSSNFLESLHDGFFVRFPVLKSLDLSKNKLKSLPSGIGACGQLSTLNLSGNKLASLPEDFGDASKSLKVLMISNNPLFGLPEVVISEVLEELHAQASVF